MKIFTAKITNLPFAYSALALSLVFQNKEIVDMFNFRRKNSFVGFFNRNKIS